MSSEFEEDYVGLTEGLQFAVRFGELGKHLVAKESLGAYTELLEEVPLISWPATTTAIAEPPPDGLTYCEGCLCVFSVRHDHVICSDSSCRARFCSTRCSNLDSHRALCGGTLPSLRSWQAAAYADTNYGAEAIARCNVQIASDVSHFCVQCGLDPASALMNASRPWQRLCEFPPDCELSLRGVSVDSLAEELSSRTRRGLVKLMTTALANDDAERIAAELVSVPHVTGLVQRLLLNTFQWSHPAAKQLRFGGVFMLMSNANHACAPNLEIAITWAKRPGTPGTPGERSHRADAPSAVEAKREAEASSIVLRTTRTVQQEEELQLSYVDTNMCVCHARGRDATNQQIQCVHPGHRCDSVHRVLVRAASALGASCFSRDRDPISLFLHRPLEERQAQLQHWGFHCMCTRCEQEKRTGLPAVAKRPTKRASPQALSHSSPAEHYHGRQLRQRVARSHSQC